MSARILFIGKDLLKENFVRERGAALHVLSEMLMEGQLSTSILAILNWPLKLHFWELVWGYGCKTRFLCTYSCFGNSEDSPTAIWAVGSLEALILEN